MLVRNIMPSIRVSKYLNDRTYFLTFTVKDWLYIFDVYERRRILIKTLQYCIENKQLRVLTFVIMLNHMHLIIQSPDVAGFIRDFKKQTSFELAKNLRIHNPELAIMFEDEKANTASGRRLIFQN